MPKPPEPSTDRLPGLYRAQTSVLLPVLSRFLMSLQVIGRENVPCSGPAILVANHLDNWDPYLCNLAIRFRAVHHFARADGMASRGLGTYWRLLGALPANRAGLQAAFRILECGGCVGIFPEGRIAPSLTRAGHGAALLALRSGAPVIPVALWGTERVRPYSVFSRPKVTIRYGPARVVTGGSARIEAVTDGLMREIAGMLPDGYRGFYAETGSLESREQDDSVSPNTWAGQSPLSEGETPNDMVSLVGTSEN